VKDPSKIIACLKAEFPVAGEPLSFEDIEVRGPRRLRINRKRESFFFRLNKGGLLPAPTP